MAEQREMTVRRGEKSHDFKTYRSLRSILRADDFDRTSSMPLHWIILLLLLLRLLLLLLFLLLLALLLLLLLLLLLVLLLVLLALWLHGYRVQIIILQTPKVE